MQAIKSLKEIEILDQKYRLMRPQIIKSLFTICIIITCGFSKVQTQTGNGTQKEYFEKMANYLSMGSGEWTGENKKYNEDNPRSPKAFGLWFERPMKNLLTLKVVAYYKDSTTLSSQGLFSWHPIKKHFIHITADRGNGYSEGVSEFLNDSTFISTMIVYRPDGKFFDHKDENFIVSENVHRNTSFKKDEQGNWVENGSWTWTRDPDKE